MDKAADGENELRAGGYQVENKMYVQGDPDRSADGETEKLRYVELQGEMSKSDVGCDHEESKISKYSKSGTAEQ